MTILTEILDRSANQSATAMAQTTTQTATRLTQTATRAGLPEGLRTVAVMIGDAAARARVVTALVEEGLTPRTVTMRDFTTYALDGPAAALVYDLAPWTDAALAFLRRLRAFPSPGSNLPVLLYAPHRPEVAQLLVEAGRFSMMWGETQFDGSDEVRRLRRVVRRVLEVTPAAVVFRLLMFYLPDLPRDLVQFCRLACGLLAEGKAEALTVSRIASALGAERRTLERRWRRMHLPAPKELLDWVVVTFAAYVAERHGIRIYAAHDLIGMEETRLRRSRLRLKTLPRADGGVELVLMHLSRRFTRTGFRRAPGDRRASVDVPLYEVGGT